MWIAKELFRNEDVTISAIVSIKYFSGREDALLIKGVYVFYLDRRQKTCVWEGGYTL